MKGVFNMYAVLNNYIDHQQWQDNPLHIHSIHIASFFFFFFSPFLKGIVILMRQNGPHRHQRLKETKSDVRFNTHDAILLITLLFPL